MKKDPEIRPGTPSASERPCDREGDVLDFDGQRVATGPCVDRTGQTLSHTAYVRPAGKSAVLTWSLGGSGAVAGILVALFFVGRPASPNGPALTLRTSLAPGPTSSPHAMASTDCAQCHQEANNVQDARCERCHDPAISARLTNAAHVFAGTRDVAAAMAAPAVQCATCHVEHRGAEVNLADVDDRECATCHRTGPLPWNKLDALAHHPEFDVVRVRTESGSGLRSFNHALHLDKVQQKFNRGCESCHEGGARAVSFQPISFDRHCSGCHNEDLSRGAGSMTPAMIAALGPGRSGLRTEDDFDVPGRKVLVGFTHADPWILKSVQSLRRSIDPASVAADRLVLDRQVAQLELVMRFAPQNPGSGAWLITPTAASPAQMTVEDALRELTEAEKSLASQLPASGAAMPAPPGKPAPAPPPPSVAFGSDSAREPLRRILDAVVARAKAAGNAGLEARAQSLLERLKNLPAGDRTPSAVDAASKGVEILLAEASAVEGPALREEARELGELARVARQRAAGRIDPTAFDRHREQMLMLLDAVRKSLQSQRPERDAQTLSLLAREESLRRLLLASTYSVPTDVAGALSRFLRERQFERARVDQELERAQIRVAAPAEREPGPFDYSDRLATVRMRLAAVAGASPLAAPLSPQDARAAVTALLGKVASSPDENATGKNRCTMCHELTSDGTQLAPVRAAGESLMPGARFTHERHVSASAGNCEMCHTGIRTSASARDVNLPGVASCATCHAPGRQAARVSGCESCHRYHAPTFGALRAGL